MFHRVAALTLTVVLVAGKHCVRVAAEKAVFASVALIKVILSKAEVESL